MANTEQNEPSPEDPFVSLSQPQLTAIEHIANGSTHTQSAEAAGVARETISRWKRVPVFEAELNRRRREVRDETTDMVRNLDHVALQGATERVRAGDAKAQTDWLRMRGLHRIDTNTIGPADPDTIIREEAAAHEQILLEEDRRLAVASSVDRLMTNEFASRKYVTDRRREESGFDREPVIPRPDTRGAIFAATSSEASSGRPDPLQGPWAIPMDGLTPIDYLTLFDVLYEDYFGARPDDLQATEVGRSDEPTGVFPLDPAVTSKLAAMSEREVFVAAVNWSAPWPNRPPMELQHALEIIGGLNNRAAVLADDQQLYLWTGPNDPSTTSEEV